MRNRPSSHIRNLRVLRALFVTLALGDWPESGWQRAWQFPNTDCRPWVSGRLPRRRCVAEEARKMSMTGEQGFHFVSDDHFSRECPFLSCGRPVGVERSCAPLNVDALLLHEWGKGLRGSCRSPVVGGVELNEAASSNWTDSDGAVTERAT